MSTGTVRLTITLDVPENVLQKAIGNFMEWPKSNNGLKNLVRQIIGEKEEVEKLLVAALTKVHPDIIKDHARLQQLNSYCNKWLISHTRYGVQLPVDQIQLAREYMAILVKYQSDELWKKRLEEIDKELSLLAVST